MRQKVTAQRIEEFIREFASGVAKPARVLLVGGATAVLFGWRESTVDVDIKIVPENDEILRKLPFLKDRFQINIELAAPDDFIPELPGWEDRCLLTQQGRLTFLHYDLYAQALAKLERRHEMDRLDVREMMKNKLIDPEMLLDLFSRIEDQLYKYPAIDPSSFREAVEDAIKEFRD